MNEDSDSRFVAVIDAIQAHRFRYSSEDELQRGLAEMLDGEGFAVEREVRLDARNRLDLLVDLSIAIEVKIAGSARDLDAQIKRYLASDRVSAVIVVTSRVRHMTVPASVSLTGKPVAVLELAGAGL